MHRLFAEALSATGAEVSLVAGAGPGRELSAIAAVTGALAGRSPDSPPAG